jgi:hypothetical protein
MDDEWWSLKGRISSTILFCIFVLMISSTARWLEVDAFQTVYWLRFMHVMMVTVVFIGILFKPSISMVAIINTYVFWITTITFTNIFQLGLSYIVNGWRIPGGKLSGFICLILVIPFLIMSLLYEIKFSRRYIRKKSDGGLRHKLEVTYRQPMLPILISLVGPIILTARLVNFAYSGPDGEVWERISEMLLW